MDKNKLQTKISHFLEGKLPKQEELELLLWIKSDKNNKDLFLKEQQLLSSRILSKKDLNLNLKWKTLKMRIDSGKKGKSPYSLFLRIASIAAAFIFGIILTSIIITQYFPISNTNAQIQNITTPHGARANFTLPDGSIVWLNSGSKLSFSSTFRLNRPVTLEGEAFFDVVKSLKPFIVSTKFGDVEVKGTSFNVKAFAEETLQATLVTGKVLFREKDSKKEVTLRPGQQVNLLDNKLKITNVETDLFTSWKDGKLIFRKEFLPEVARRLERWYNVKIILENDKRLANIWYSGTLKMESFSEVLELLSVTASINYTYNEKTRTINIKYKQ